MKGTTLLKANCVAKIESPPTLPRPSGVGDAGITQISPERDPGLSVFGSLVVIVVSKASLCVSSLFVDVCLSVAVSAVSSSDEEASITVGFRSGPSKGPSIVQEKLTG